MKISKSHLILILSYEVMKLSKMWIFLQYWMTHEKWRTYRCKLEIIFWVHLIELYVYKKFQLNRSSHLWDIDSRSCLFLGIYFQDLRKTVSSNIDGSIFLKMACVKIPKTLSSMICVELSEASKSWLNKFTYGIREMTVVGKYCFYGIHSKVTANLSI